MEKLELGKNKISDVGMEHLSLALTKNTTLERLSLGYNQIGDIGIDHLIKAVQKGIALDRLGLDDNSQISDNKKEKLKEEWKKAGNYDWRLSI